ncbi:2-oxoglutarate ferredoxin oxidoreductase, beta subunit [Desulfobulbus propionicus DSM 2032]|jgi:2-oxoglutarate ferredoxin oxidoreductase subunit beta|uniref:2-oxoglutarate ferredoxin oxidoreductase, beta subunit n=1 Tax=Desulfobulbus propionicus (strain ATCC 33891 / DSM 2032 / VKM B-1956 / 1pr3) TaxID=577650 RepID=A0A7U3YM48_DESPD|nr:2-oxoacid:ferredoxin oxidoreductase subunit beta [Desulfobulbus propionicus]ADW17916.1 2-oxoglutarate ferredoxin oxidoreductase, beta subunit [Desulfobulbus propionicus DSM 2032]
MTVPAQAIRHEYLRHNKKFPHVWCPGCGNGIVMAALLRAIYRLELSKDEVVLASGIGCSGRMPTYLDFNTLHTTHGRALTFATGVKLANPALNVVVIMGDGDATAIGGNHFIHAARRNLNLTAIIINNSIYGMTGGQYSPTTPFGARSTTSVYGHIEQAFSIAELAVTAGAAFVARSTVYHADLIDQLIEQAMRKQGFAVVEVISNCHVQYGRRNQLGDAVEMLTRFRDQAITVSKAAKLSAEELAGRITIGVLADRDLPISTEEYDKVRQRASEEGMLR